MTESLPEPDLPTNPAATQLRVLDAETGLTVEGVDIWGDHFDLEGLLHPSPRNGVRLQNGMSPLSVSPTHIDHYVAWIEFLTVTARGYAWTKVVVDHQRPTTRVVELQRAGSIQVRILKGLADQVVAAGLRLRMREHVIDSKAPYSSNAQTQQVEEAIASNDLGHVILDVPAPQPNATITLDKIPPGCHLLTVELDPQSRPSHILEYAIVRVTADQATRVEFDLTTATIPATPTQPPKVDIHGVLRIHPSWEQSELFLDLVATRIPAQDEEFRGPEHSHRALMHEFEDPRIRPWSLLQIPPGRYSISNTIGLRELLEAGPEESGGVQLEIPEPIDVEVELLDDTTGLIIRDDLSMTWHRPLLHPYGGYAVSSATWNAETGRYQLRAPRGAIGLAIEDFRFRLLDHEDITISPSERLAHIRAKRLCGVVVTLSEDGIRLPWDKTTKWDLQLLDPDTKTKDFTCFGEHPEPSEHAMFIQLDRPGSYLLVVPHQNGFKPTESILVTIPDEQFVAIDVSMRSKTAS